jgi:Spy/CpxP family protein refolding chaperone
VLDSAAFDRYIANHRAKENAMNRIRSLAIGALLIFALAVLAQQTVTTPGTSSRGRAEGGGMPTVEEQLKVLTEKLDLTATQRAKVGPILQKLDDATEKLMQDERLSREERLTEVRPQRKQADKKIRALLNDDQAKKLDQYLAGPHPEMHGGLSGAMPPPQR